MKTIKHLMVKAAFLTIALLSVMSLSAQTRQLKGVVKDEAGEALLGATVLVEGTSTAATTAADGTFAIELRGTANTLIVSYLGMNDKTVVVGNETFVEIALSGAVMIEDMVVVGYGTTRRGDLTGSVSSVKSEDIISPASASVGTMLRGKAAGLNITQTTAKPGGEVSLSIRGQGAPLIVVDGVPQAAYSQFASNTSYYGGNNDNTLISINPEDIESVDILKDAASTAIYGADAAGGVILITTKKGRASQQNNVDVSYNGSYSVQQLSDWPEFLDAKDYMIQRNAIAYELDNTKGQYSLYTQSQIENFKGKGTNWIDEVTRLGQVSDHNLSIRNGNENTQYLASFGFYDNKGVAKNNDMMRLTGRLNLDQKFNRWLSGGVNAAYTYLFYNNVPIGDRRQDESALIYSAMTFCPLVSVYDADGNYSKDPNRGIYPNPVSLLEITDQTSNQNLNANAYLQLAPFDGMTIKATVGIDDKNTRANQYVPRTTVRGANFNGQASKNEGENTMFLSNVIATYNKQLGNSNLNLMLGWEYKRNSWNGTYVTANNFPSDSFLWNSLQLSEQEDPYISSYKGSSEFASYFGRLNYSYGDRYFLTANVRIDGSSNFSKEHQYGVFPGVSAAWKLSSEEFLKDSSAISNLKLRAGWGQVGNASYLTGIDTFYRIMPNAYAFDGTMVNGALLAQLGNPNLKWQTATDINFGLDLGLWNNRFSATIDVYQRIEKDIITTKSLMSYQEISTIDFNSAMQYRTRGIDLTLNTVNVSTRDFTWTTDLTFSYYQTYTIARDADWNPDIYQTYEERWGNVWLYRSVGLVQDGETVAWMPTAQAGNIKYADLNGYKVDDAGVRQRDENGRYIYTDTPDGVLDNADLYLAGNTTPIPFGINNSFRKGNWDFSFYIYGSLNGFRSNELLALCSGGVTDMTYGLNALASLKERWSPENPTGTLPSVTNENSGVAYTSGDFFYENAWYARLDNVQLGYTFSSPRLNRFCKSIRAYVSARNLYVLTPFGGMDPETGNGFGAYPNQRTFVFGLNVNF